MNSSYITSAAKPEQLPKFGLPELAFIGRSNCGKSSLLNAFLEHKNLARASRTPGRTQMVNFFKMDESLIIADLPGYGFSAVKLETKEGWQRLLDAYFRRKDIALLAFLIDGRRRLDGEDLEVLKWLSEIRPTALILTKADKLNRAETQSALREAGAAAAAKKIKIWGEVRAISSLKKSGVKEFRESALEFVGISSKKTGRR